MVGDVDVVQLDHHGSTTANNQTFLSALKAEVAFAQTGETNTFGHPNRETANKFLNTPDTAGATLHRHRRAAGTGTGPVFYQNEASPAGDDRVTQQGYTGAAAGNAGHGTVLLVDRRHHHLLDEQLRRWRRADQSGAAHLRRRRRVARHHHRLQADGGRADVAGRCRWRTRARDRHRRRQRSRVADRQRLARLQRSNGVAQAPVAMTLAGGVYQATIPAQPDGTRVDYTVTGDAGAQSTIVQPRLLLRRDADRVAARAERERRAALQRLRGAHSRHGHRVSGFSPGTNDDYVQDATGAINVYRSTDTADAVHVDGARAGRRGARPRSASTAAACGSTSPSRSRRRRRRTASSCSPPGPAPTPAADHDRRRSARNPESFEGQFVSIANVSRSSAARFPPTPQSLDAFVTISDGTGDVLAEDRSRHRRRGLHARRRPFTLVGIVQQDDYLRPFDSGYNVTPRSRVDLGAAAPAPPPLLTHRRRAGRPVNNVDGTPGARLRFPIRSNQLVTVHGAVSSIDFRGGNGIEYYIQDATGGIDLFNSAINFGRSPSATPSKRSARSRSSTA